VDGGRSSLLGDARPRRREGIEGGGQVPRERARGAEDDETVGGGAGETIEGIEPESQSERWDGERECVGLDGCAFGVLALSQHVSDTLCFLIFFLEWYDVMQSNKSSTSLRSHPHDTVPVFASDVAHAKSNKSKSKRVSPRSFVPGSFEEGVFPSLDYGEI